MLCQFCSCDIPLLPRGEKEGRTRQELRSLTHHLVEEHKVSRARGVMLVVEYLTSQEQQFLQLSLDGYWATIGNHHNKHVSCAFCGDGVLFESEVNIEGIIIKLCSHIKVKHKVMALENILTAFSLLPEVKMSQLIDMLILKNGFRSHKYNIFLAVINEEKKEKAKQEDSKKMCALESKLGSILERPPTLNKVKKLFKCDFCSYSNASSLSDLRKHIMIHTYEKPVRCDVEESCLARFRTSGQLTHHRRRRHTLEKRFNCTFCGKDFVEKGELTRHLLVHKKVREKVIKCSLCEHSTDTPGNMSKHMKSHFPDEKTLKCDICGKLFGNKAHLERHLQIHNSSLKKKFSCEKCSQSFLEKYNLKQHVDNVHNNVQRFVCKECGEKLRKRCDLTFHIEINHPDTAVPNPEWKCIECGKFYPHSRALKTHKKLVHNTEPRHACKPCGRVFKMKTKLDLHVKGKLHVNLVNKIEMKMYLELSKSEL